MKRILILGVSGTLGHIMFKTLFSDDRYDVWGTIRSPDVTRHFNPAMVAKTQIGIDALNLDRITQIMADLKPDVVINCIGLVKQHNLSTDPLYVLPINAMLPHRLAHICALVGSRLLHFSTDCVFSGKRGDYVESDPQDATDLYGQSKFIGEVNYEHAITLRTSFIGHELETSYELLEWFLRQEGSVRGFTGAIYTGLPTVVLARIVRDIVLPRSDLSGLYHIASTPISKFDLLKIVAKVYQKKIEIVPDNGISINRSLNASKFRKLTGYVAKPWPSLIEEMYEYR